MGTDVYVALKGLLQAVHTLGVTMYLSQKSFSIGRPNFMNFSLHIDVVKAFYFFQPSICLLDFPSWFLEVPGPWKDGGDGDVPCSGVGLSQGVD